MDELKRTFLNLEKEVITKDNEIRKISKGLQENMTTYVGLFFEKEMKDFRMEMTRTKEGWRRRMKKMQQK